MIKISDSIIDGLKVIVPHIVKDFRGEYVNVYNSLDYGDLLVYNKVWKEDDVSISHKNVLRGFHGDNRTWKLIQCLHGAFILGVVDCRVGSNLWKTEFFRLDDKTHTQILVPSGCANCHYVLTESSIFSYKQSELYEGMEKQFTLKYDDSRLNINWVKYLGELGNVEFNPIVSERDSESQEGFNGVENV